MTYTTDEKLTSSKAVKDYMRLQLSQEKNEIFATVILDNRHGFLSGDTMPSEAGKRVTVNLKNILDTIS